MLRQFNPGGVNQNPLKVSWWQNIHVEIRKFVSGLTAFFNHSICHGYAGYRRADALCLWGNHIPLVLEEISMLSFWRCLGHSKLKSITKYKHVKREGSLTYDTDLSSLIMPSLKTVSPELPSLGKN